ncbi:MAG TPA: phenylacetate--CoA ligase family protein [Methylomirabilota bacterium]|nr:phenylacetate--CoA ligase family protein [Methylomirabilota bacterium]
MRIGEALRRRIAQGAYRLQEHLIGRETFLMLSALDRSQWLEPAELESLQRRNLVRLLAVALAHSPWHAERIEATGLAEALAEGTISPADFRRLPTMGKVDARDNCARILWQGVPGGAFRYNTGGSSGEPLQFHFGRSRQASDAAGRMRARAWWGVQVGDPEVYLWGAPVELGKTDRVKTLRDWAINQVVLNAFEMSPARMDGYLGAIQARQPVCLYGYASSLALLAAHAEARHFRFRLPRLRVVCTTGEPLYPHQRELIARVFGAPVANEFGSRDIGFTAHETPAGQMLLLSENVLLEVLGPDGEPVPPGELGEAVMTGLVSDAQPFIRYRTGDMVRLSTRVCREGRGLHVIEEVAGRRTDFVVRPDGTIMHALAVIYVLRAVPGIRQFKCVQHAADFMEVLVVADPVAWSADSEGAIIAGLRQRLGPDLRLALRMVDDIPPEASGKHRYVVSHVRLDPALQPAARPAS